MALGLWAAVGSGGAAFGPLVGGMLLEHFYWGSVFLINVPIVLVVIAINAKVVPRQPAPRPAAEPAAGAHFDCGDPDAGV